MVKLLHSEAVSNLGVHHVSAPPCGVSRLKRAKLLLVLPSEIGKQVNASASRGPGSRDRNEHSKIWPVSSNQKQTWCSSFRPSARVQTPGARCRSYGDFIINK